MPEKPPPGEILQRLYDSEINAGIEWVWDGGVKWQLGDELNGWRATGSAATVALAVPELAEDGAAEYPESDFAEWWRRRGS